MRRAVQTADWLARRQRRPGGGGGHDVGVRDRKVQDCTPKRRARSPGRKPALVAAVGAFVRAFEPLREALGGRLITAADADALGPKLTSALRGNELVLLKASRGVALGTVLP